MKTFDTQHILHFISQSCNGSDRLGSSLCYNNGPKKSGVKNLRLHYDIIEWVMLGISWDLRVFSLHTSGIFFTHHWRITRDSFPLLQTAADQPTKSLENKTTRNPIYQEIVYYFSSNVPEKQLRFIFSTGIAGTMWYQQLKWTCYYLNLDVYITLSDENTRKRHGLCFKPTHLL